MAQKPIDKAVNATAVDWSEYAICFSAFWITVALIASPLFGIRWLGTGDFEYSTAMYYHGIMIPVLVMLYLLTRKALHVKRENSRIYEVTAILSVSLVGVGSFFNVDKHFSLATTIQVIGMVAVDLLGIALVISLAVMFWKKDERIRRLDVAFWLLLCSLIAVLVSAPFGHLAGWLGDFDVMGFPGLNMLFKTTGMNYNVFRDGLMASHSHLIVVSVLCALAAITATFFQYQSLAVWRKRISKMGLWMALVGLLAATIIYILSAILGWEPPSIFTSGPNGINGMPLDDVVLTVVVAGFLVLMIGLFGCRVRADTNLSMRLKAKIRIAVFLNWICGFVGAVIMGIYIEFNEVFYGAGVPPAPGALNDNIFIRAHMLYPFFLLPITFLFLLVIGYKYNSPTAISRRWPYVFVWVSILGMLLSLIGEFVWIFTLNKNIFSLGLMVMVMALVAGSISLLPEAGFKYFNRNKIHKVAD